MPAISILFAPLTCDEAHGFRDLECWQAGHYALIMFGILCALLFFGISALHHLVIFSRYVIRAVEAQAAERFQLVHVHSISTAMQHAVGQLLIVSLIICNQQFF